MSANFTHEGSFAPDNLVIEPGLARKITVKAGANAAGVPLPRGTVVGMHTASRKYLKSLSAASDGSQEPDMILSETVDASAADVEVIAYMTGRYNSNALTIGVGHTVASVDDAFRRKSLFIEASMKSPV